MVVRAKKNDGVCKLTGRKGAFVKAHIIPRAFYTSNGGVKSYSSDASRRAKRSPIGLYDSALVISETERAILQPLDDYGVRFLRQQEGRWLPLISEEVCVGWAVIDFDCSTLKKFFNSVLWRAVASDMTEPKLDIGVRETELLALVAADNAGHHLEFAVSLIRYDLSSPAPVMCPVLREIDGSLGALAFFGGTEVLWYIDPPNLSVEPERILRTDKPLVVLNRKWKGSRPESMLLELAANNGLI